MASMNPQQLNRHPGLRITLVVALVVLLMLGATAVASVYRRSATPVEPAAPDDFRITLDQERSVEGTTLRLTAAEFASDGTLLELLVSWPGFDPATGLMPIAPRDLTVSGVSGATSYFGSTGQAQPRDGAVPVTLLVGPPTPEPADIVVEIKRIGLVDDESTRWLDGPWSFTIPAAEVVHDPINIPIPVGKTVESGPIAITIDTVHLSSRAVSVSYRVPAMTTGEAMPAGPVVRLALPDGKAFAETGRGGIRSSNDVWMALFPALPEGVDSFHLTFGSFVIPTPGPVEVSFAIPAGFWEATADATFAVGQTFDVDGETLEVVSIGKEANAEVSVVVRNIGQQGSRNVTIVGPVIAGQVLTDNRGNRVQALGGAMGLADDGSGSQEAGESVLRFELPKDSTATELTLRVDHYGKIVAGPEPITITVP